MAQLNDCHSCNDARSIVQKTNGIMEISYNTSDKKEQWDYARNSCKNIVQDPSLLEVQKSPKKNLDGNTNP